MIHQKLLDSVSEQLGQLMGGMSALPGQQELQQQIRSTLQSTFSRLDLVTRDEFDTQTAVLMRTREKLELLEKQVAAIEAQLAPAAQTAEETAPAAKDDSAEA